jgi:hypothetical protein
MLHSTHTQVVHIAMQNLKLLIPFETFRSERGVTRASTRAGLGPPYPARTTPAAAGRRDRDATGLSALHSACDVAAAGSARGREEAAGGGLATAGLALTWALTIGALAGTDGRQGRSSAPRRPPGCWCCSCCSLSSLRDWRPIATDQTTMDGRERRPVGKTELTWLPLPPRTTTHVNVAVGTARPARIDVKADTGVASARKSDSRRIRQIWP